MKNIVLSKNFIALLFHRSKNPQKFIAGITFFLCSTVGVVASAKPLR
jgi:hypothetical protein